MKLPPVRDGYRRFYHRCNESQCGRAYYADFVPGSLSNPILSLDCGHDARAMERVTRKEFEFLRAAWKRKQVKPSKQVRRG